MSITTEICYTVQSTIGTPQIPLAEVKYHRESQVLCYQITQEKMNQSETLHLMLLQLIGLK